MKVLSINLNFVYFSVFLDDIMGQIFSLIILTVASAESAIGLALMVLFFNIKLQRFKERRMAI